MNIWNDEDLKRVVELSQARQKTVKEVDNLLEEWQGLTAEAQREKLHSLFCDIAEFLPEEDRQLCIEKLAQGGIIKNKREVIKKVRELAEGSKPEKSKKGAVKEVHASFIQLSDGSLLEMLYDPSKHPSVFFAFYKDEEVQYRNEVKLENGTIVKPYTNPLILDLVEKGVVLLPSEATEYEDERSLSEEIKEFIHKYLDIGDFEDIVSLYPLFSNVYDRSTACPYLRAIGQEEGIGKTRFIQTIGSICYKPIFASGATTAAPIFRLIDLFKSTLIVDEGDIKNSVDWADIIKIYNCGFTPGIPVLRCDTTSYDPRAYDVYCPKILATKRHFDDKNLESRFIIKEMQETERDDIPILLPLDFSKEATAIRNKLLMWRFRKFDKISVDESLRDRTMKARLNQVTIPLLNVTENEDLRKRIKDIVRSYSKELRITKGMELEGDVIKAIDDLWRNEEQNLTMKALTTKINEELDEKDKVTSRKVGHLTRQILRFRVERRSEGYCLLRNEANRKKLNRLKERYGLEENQSGEGGESE